MEDKGLRSVSALHRMIQDNGYTMSRRTLDKFYNNDSNRLDYDTIGTLCVILGCDVGDLLYLEENEGE